MVIPNERRATKPEGILGAALRGGGIFPPAGVAFVVLLGYPFLTCAQQVIDPDPDDQASAARYTVELIVFTYGAEGSAGNEIFVPDALPDDIPGDGLSAVHDGEAGPVFDDRSWPAEFGQVDESEEQSSELGELPVRARIELQLLEPDQYSMQDIYRKLADLDAYRPIMHTAWQQTTHDRDQSPALHLRALGNPPLGLDGTVTLYQGRFVHLDVDLTLDAGTGESQLSSATNGPYDDGDGGLFRPPVRYRISEDRIMRQSDIRYFDHPRFGLIAKVTRADTDDQSRRGVRDDAATGN